MDSSDSALQRRDLKFTRLYYFFFYGGVGFISPFLNIFYVRLGLSGTQIGWNAAVASLITLVAAPFWANKGERWLNPRVMLQMALLLSALGYFLLAWQTVFWGIVAVTIFRTLVGAGLSPLSDGLALAVTRVNRAGFGSVRVWASIGWVVTVLFSGWLIQRTDLRAGLLGAGLTTIVGAAVVLGIRSHHFSGRGTGGQQTASLRTVVRGLQHNPGMVGVALMLITIGSANNGVAQFETVYLDTLGAKETVIGIAGMLSAVVEIPCMLLADRLASRKGAFHLLLIAMLMLAALRGLVFLIPAVMTILVERAVGGVAFSFYTVALIRLIGQQTDPQETRTVLALYTVTLASLIGMVAPPFAGAAYDRFGARWLYPIAAAGYLLAWIILRQARRSLPNEARAAPDAIDAALSDVSLLRRRAAVVRLWKRGRPKDWGPIESGKCSVEPPNARSRGAGRSASRNFRRK
jgi:PPP family 3-phenylpropionic acid transporter